MINEVELAFLILLPLSSLYSHLRSLSRNSLQQSKKKKVYIFYKQLFDHILRSTQTFL